MNKEYIGYITTTRTGKFRGRIGSLHDVGEPDGDRTIYQVAMDDNIHEELSDAVDALREQCQNASIEKICVTPVKPSMVMFESELPLEE